MWVTKLLISPVKKRIFCPKTTKFGPKLAFLVNLGQAMQAYSVPCWWVGWWLWRAGCISQDTYLLYFYHFLQMVVFDNFFADCPSGQLYLNFSFSKFSKHFSLKEDNISATPCLDNIFFDNCGSGSRCKFLFLLTSSAKCRFGHFFVSCRGKKFFGRRYRSLPVCCKVPKLPEFQKFFGHSY